MSLFKYECFAVRMICKFKYVNTTNHIDELFDLKVATKQTHIIKSNIDISMLQL